MYRTTHSLEIKNDGLVLNLGLADNGILLEAPELKKKPKNKNRSYGYYPIYYDKYDREFLKDEKYIFLQDLLERYFDVGDRQTAVINQSRSMLTQTFPEMEKMFRKIDCNASLAIFC